MPLVQFDGREIAYLDEGKGNCILLIHGFGSNRAMNWIGPGWVAALLAAGYRVIAFDNRGHGESTKFYHEDDYSLQFMAGDCLALLDALSIKKCHIMGYSMGARIAAWLAVNHGERFEKVILGGNAMAIVEGSGDWTPVRDALLTDDTDAITDARGRAFRQFADQTGSDLKALAACVMGTRQSIAADQMATITNRVLVAVGSEDEVAGSPQALVKLMMNARYLPIPGRDHMRAVGDKAYIAGALEFLKN